MQGVWEEAQQVDAEENAGRSIYQIRVQGWLDDSWSDWFAGLTIAHAGQRGRDATSTLTGLVADQPALRGILGRIWDLNLTLVSVMRISRTSREAQERSGGC